MRKSVEHTEPPGEAKSVVKSQETKVFECLVFVKKCVLIWITVLDGKS